MRKYKSRLEKWKEPIRVPCAYNTIDDIEFSNFLKNRSQLNFEDRKITYDEMIGASKELIFDIRDGKPVFICINITLDTYKFDLVISEGWQTVPDEMNQEEIDEHVVSTLARASMQSVPVYPNTEECEPILAQYYEELVINGFLANNSDGTKVRLINTDSPKEKIKDIKYLLSRDVSIDMNPAELAIIKKVAKETFSKLSQAEKVLLNLTQGINEFSEILNDTERNEREIQNCLKNNPILFGLEYIRVIPEHRLGSEYIIDYGLEKYSGNFDVVELESSNLSLYNRKGDPSSYLVHAEQQVIDWLAWIELNSPYAQTKLPGISSPKGFVIIGRSHGMSEDLSKKLKWRNITFGDRMQILTYDDLLNRAINILNILQQEKN